MSPKPSPQGPIVNTGRALRPEMPAARETPKDPVAGAQSTAGNQRLQRALLAPHADRESAAVMQTALHGASGAGSAYPHANRIQAAFGTHDIRDARASVGGDGAAAAKKLNARAYTVGSKTAFRSEPDLRLAAHEAAHIVQQKSALNVPGGVGVPGDAHEKHADAVADAVVAGRSAENLLGKPNAHARASRPVVQFDGFGDVRIAEGRMEKQALIDGAAAEAKFYRLANMFDDYPCWQMSSPRDLAEFMAQQPGVMDEDYEGVFKFNQWVTRNQATMHPEPIERKLDVKLKANHYSPYAGDSFQAYIEYGNNTARNKYWNGQIFAAYRPAVYYWSGFAPDGPLKVGFYDPNAAMGVQVETTKPGRYFVFCTLSIYGRDDPAFRLTVAEDKPIVAHEKDPFATEAFRAVRTTPDAEGNPAAFVENPGGMMTKAGDAKAFTLEQQYAINSMKIGMLKGWLAQGKIKQDEYDKAVKFFQERNEGLSKASLPSNKLYIMRGVFVSDAEAVSIPISAVMANNLPNRGEYVRVTLQDVTLDPKSPTEHEGKADKPNSVEKSAWGEAERKAIQDMAEHWHKNNDYPHGTVSLYIASQLAPGTYFTVTIPQDNWKKDLKSVLGVVAMVAALGALFLGQVEISAPLMYVAAGAGLASIALGIEHRIQMGTFGFDTELLIDVLAVAATFLGLGAASNAFRTFSYAGKAFYLVAMGAADASTMVLIGVEAKHSIDALYGPYVTARNTATTEAKKREIDREFQDNVAGIIGGAIVSESFLVVSATSTLRSAGGLRETTPPDVKPIVGEREPLVHPELQPPPAKPATPAKPAVKPAPKPQPKPQPKVEPKVEPKPKLEPKVEPEPKPEPKQEPAKPKEPEKPVEPQKPAEQKKPAESKKPPTEKEIDQLRAEEVTLKDDRAKKAAEIDREEKQLGDHEQAQENLDQYQKDNPNAKPNDKELVDLRYKARKAAKDLESQKEVVKKAKEDLKAMDKRLGEIDDAKKQYYGDKPWRQVPLKNPADSNANNRAGLVGELQMSSKLQEAGYKPQGDTVNAENVRTIDDFEATLKDRQGHQDIDGVYKKETPEVIDYVVGESKASGDVQGEPTGVGSLETMKTGKGERQMSPEWVDNRLDSKGLAKQDVANIRAGLEKPGTIVDVPQAGGGTKRVRVRKVYSQTDPSGTRMNEINNVSDTEVKIGKSFDPHK